MIVKYEMYYNNITLVRMTHIHVPLTGDDAILRFARRSRHGHGPRSQQGPIRTIEQHRQDDENVPRDVAWLNIRGAGLQH